MSYIEKELSWIDEKDCNKFSAEKFLSDVFSSDNTSVISGEYAIFAAPLTFSIAFTEMKEALNIEAEDISYEDLYVKFTESLPEMLTLEEITALAEKFINDFINENGGHYLRIWDATSNQGYFNSEPLTCKYYKLVPILQKWFTNWLKENLDVRYKVEAYLIGEKIKREISQYSFISMEYGKEDCEQLWGILRTIHRNFYDIKLINSLQDVIQELITFCCPNDYQNCDLNKENLYQLYTELGEILYKKDTFKGHDLFYDYDGYGNIIFDLDGTVCTDMYYEVDLQDGEQQ